MIHVEGRGDSNIKLFDSTQVLFIFLLLEIALRMHLLTLGQTIHRCVAGKDSSLTNF